MKRKIKVGTTSKRIKVFIQDSSATTGAGLTGLVFNTASLTAYYIKDGDSSTTAITLVTATLGTYTSGGFKEVDAINMPGVYEIGLPNAAIASGNCTHIFLRGATNMAPCPIEIELDAVDYQDAVRFGLTAMPNAASGAAGSLLTSGTGTAQLATSGGLVTLAGVTHTGAVIPTVSDVVTKTGYSLVAGTGLGNQTANITGNLSGSVGSVTGLTVANLDATISSRASGTDLATVANNLDTEIAAIQAKTDLIPASPAAVGDIPTASVIATAVEGTQVLSRLDSMIESNGSGQFRFDTIALELAPTGGGGGGGGATDWTVDERTAIRSILGIPGSGTTPADPTVGILDTIRDKTALIPAEPASRTNITAGVITSVASAIVLPTIPTGWITQDGIATDAIGENEISAAAIAKIQNGLASQGSLDVVNDFIDTIDITTTQIKAKTDLIPTEPASRTNITTAAGITVSAIGTNVITANSLAADAATEIANAVAATQILNRLDSMVESNGQGQFRFDTVALSLSPAGGGGSGGTVNITVEDSSITIG
jgi:hypothetical protein